MVIEVAQSVALGVLGRLLRGAVSIKCTKCGVQSKREARTRRRAEERQGEGQRLLGYTIAEINALRRAIIARSRVTRIAGRQHRGALDHGVPDEIVLRAINNPQRILVARNGNWIFYRNGTIVVTPRNNPGFINTALRLVRQSSATEARDI